MTRSRIEPIRVIAMNSRALGQQPAARCWQEPCWRCSSPYSHRKRPVGWRDVDFARSTIHVREWMGHADLSTTRRYLAFVDREDAAKRVSEAFRFEVPEEPAAV